VRKKYEKYLMCNFGYFDSRGSENQYVSLIFTHIDKGLSQHCDRCGERLNGKQAYYFTEDTVEQEAWVFGSTCVGHVFGIGLGK